MAESTIKATIILLLGLTITVLITARWINCEGSYCPSVKHAVEKWEGLKNGK